MRVMKLRGGVISRNFDELLFLYLPDLKTLMSVLTTLEAASIAASTPPAAIDVSAIQDMSCVASKFACVSLTDDLKWCRNS